MTDENDEKERQAEILFRRSYVALMDRYERDRQAGGQGEAEAAAGQGEQPGKVVSLAERRAALRIDHALQLADMLVDLYGNEINKPSTFDDAEVPRQMIEEAAERWGVGIKDVEMYAWDLHDRGAPYQFIREWLVDIED